MTALAVLSQPRRPQHVVARTLISRIATISRWFWLIVVLAVVVITTIWAQFTQPPWSVTAWARQAVIWFSFSQAIAVVTGGLPAYVGAGLTRRAFLRGSLASHLVMALAHAVLLTALIQAERLAHGALGWGFTITDGVLDQSGRSVGLLLADYAVTFVVAGLSGLLVGSIYLRGGGWWGTLTLPFTVGPVLVFGGAWGAGLALAAPASARLAVLLGAGGATALVMAVVFALVVRGTQLRTTS